MIRLLISTLLIIGMLGSSCGQSSNLKIKQKKYVTSDKTEILGEVGYLEVPENRKNPESRSIKIKFVRLKSLSNNPENPLIYLEGGGSAASWQADKPDYLSDWIPLLEVSDVILVDQRGTADNKLQWLWTGKYPEDFLVTAEAAGAHYEEMATSSLAAYSKRGVDVLGYNVFENAKDINELKLALGIDNYSIFGFSYGSHLGLALIKMYGRDIENAVLIGTDGLNHSFNYPSLLDEHVEKIAEMVKQDEAMQKEIPDFPGLLNRVMMQLDNSPAIVEVKNPFIKKKMKVKVGSFGLALILRLDIDDASDIPVIPRLLYSIDQGDYSLLEWFAQKRFARAFGLPGNGITQGISAGASAERWSQIQKEASESLFGDVVNFPFSDARKAWPEIKLDINMVEPLVSSVRTLFISGDLDCRTPVVQTEEIRLGFTNSTHLIVKNAGHEQSMWHSKIFGKAIPDFLRGKDVKEIDAAYKPVKFISIHSTDQGQHPSLRKK